jgi:uncharacterized membrane-anchored protein YjiN (DUF445 family)
MAAAPLSPIDEPTRRRELNKMKRVATGALVVALAIFIVARWLEADHSWLGYVRATAEAAMIGGLADWFAVTALFRHPLGIPIPHTAIMQTQKDRVGRILGNFVQNHFLSRAVLEQRLGGIKASTRAATWLDDAEHRRQLARHMAGGLARAVETLPDAEVRQFMQRSAASRLEEIQLAPLVGDVLSVAAADGRPQELLDEVMRAVGAAIRDSGQTIRDKVREESPRWLPAPVRNALAERILAGVERLLAEMGANPEHPIRRRFDTAVSDFIIRMRSSPEMHARMEKFKRELIGHPIVEELVSSVWDRARSAAAKYRADPEQASLEPLEEVLSALADSLTTNDDLRKEVDLFVIEVITSLLEQHREEVADLIAATVADWDPEVAATRIELAVGRDLQFVRLNGTLVGGLAGLIIYSISRLF